MKRCSIILLALLVACTNSNQKENSNEGAQTSSDTVSRGERKPPVKIVYITKDGDKFHTADCSYSENAYPIELRKARAEGKRACSVCRPLRTKDQIQCTGITAEGKQCQRMTTNTSGKCFQHNKP